MTLEAYLRQELARGAIDFAFRAHTFNGGPVEIYIHPLNRDGATTPTLLVEGNVVSEKPPVRPPAAHYGHGHVVPREDGLKVRCGGPALCSVCAIEQAAAR